MRGEFCGDRVGVMEEQKQASGLPEYDIGGKGSGRNDTDGKTNVKTAARVAAKESDPVGWELAVRRWVIAHPMRDDVTEEQKAYRASYKKDPEGFVRDKTALELAYLESKKAPEQVGPVVPEGSVVVDAGRWAAFEAWEGRERRVREEGFEAVLRRVLEGD